MSNYDDIINHPHYQSKKRPHMSMINRAAQFAPFAALTGYDDSISEATNENLKFVENFIEFEDTDPA